MFGMGVFVEFISTDRVELINIYQQTCHLEENRFFHIKQEKSGLYHFNCYEDVYIFYVYIF